MTSKPYQTAATSGKNRLSTDFFRTLARLSDVCVQGFLCGLGDGDNGRGELTFVAGAPRANHTGAVVLLKKDNVYRLVPQHIFWERSWPLRLGILWPRRTSTRTGEQREQVKSVRWTDVIVGAPNFFDRKAEIGGAVYVYLNPFGHWDDHSRPIRLNGTYDSMFGMTVSSVGDLDQDGYGDIAVGAPFDGDGKVFIYRGSDSGIETKPAQVLDGRDFDVRRFGYSISGGLDLDHNHYPDLAVGSLNDSVVLFSVDVKACFLFTSHPEHYNPHITLWVHFEADTERRKLGLPHRVNFLGRSSLEAEFTQTEELHENIRDKLRPISLAITHTIKPVPPRRHSGAKRLEKLPPVLNVSPSNTLHSEINFLREGCGSDKICQSNLKLGYQFGTRPLTSDLFTPLPRDEDQVQVFSLSDQRVVVLELEVTNFPSDPLNPDEDGDDAHAAQLLITLPNTLSYAGSRLPLRFDARRTRTALRWSVTWGILSKKQQSKYLTLKFSISLSTANITIETTELTADLLLSTISEQSDLATVTALAKVVIELPLSSGDASQLFFSGPVKGESAMSSLEEIGSSVDFEFVVSNPGQALQTLGSAFLNIMFPHEMSNGKWLLYPSSLRFEGNQCSPKSAINPLQLPASVHTQPENNKVGRTRRSHPEDEGEVTIKGNGARTTPAVAASERRKSLKLDCLLGSARCLLFQCPLHSFSGQAVLKIQARLWDASFVEEFPSVSALEVMVRANITVKSTIKHLVLRDAAHSHTEETTRLAGQKANLERSKFFTSRLVPVMIYPEPGLSDQYWIPWWIILIAVLAGILLLTLLVCILWKCGFFRRAPYKDKLPQYHAVKIPREDRPQFQTQKPAGGVHKKEWATHWSDGTL
ncbi:hypothetical protein WMY93_014342 [Mugilogobius chulae]|uniref:Integrin alpha-2 domain-containing protein n=1 Tax=Mugilogobius chulae TaxID=88201 RepID=A0AAW0P462_9GOBI